MSPGISFDTSTVSLQRTEARPAIASNVRLLNRLSGTRNANAAAEVAPAGSSKAEGPRPAVVKAHPSAAAGDMLESLPDEESARKQREVEKKKIEMPMIDSRLEVQLLSQVREAAKSAYKGAASQSPKVDIRV